MEERIYSVKDINNEIKKITGQFFMNILVEGEISSINFHNTGNVYLSLKDEESLLSAMIFKNAFKAEYRELLKEGVKVVARGAISVYLKNGSYSLNIREVRVKGQGDLYEKFLKLKEKLEKAGLFDTSRKRNLPVFPKRIGVVTSPDGAAVKDILSVTRRRFPFTSILVIPALVQGGDEAAESVVRGIQAANAIEDLDLLIVGRGGGSYEELSLFNHEGIAYAIYESQIPVISAVGHERDFTIADFVADRRAATPSQAAEMAVPDREDLKRSLNQSFQRVQNHVSYLLNEAEAHLSSCRPERLLWLLNAKIDEDSRDLDYYLERMEGIFQRKTDRAFLELAAVFQSLEKLNPLYILNRNYAIAREEASGKILTSVLDIKPGETLGVTLKDGKILSRVESILPEKEIKNQI